MENATTTIETNFSLVRDGYERLIDVSLFMEIIKQKFNHAGITIIKTEHIKKSIDIDILEIGIRKEQYDVRLSIEFKENGVLSDKIEVNNFPTSNDWEEMYSKDNISLETWNKNEFTSILTKIN